MRRRIWQSGLVLVVALACLAGGAASVLADGWLLPPTPLAAGANGPSGAVVAVDAGGDAAAAWTGDDGLGTQSLVVATRPAGGAWSAGTPLVSAPYVDAPAVAIDATGTATVMWVDSADGSAFAVHATRGDVAGGGWSAPPHDFPTAGVADPLTQLRTDAAGTVVAAWVEHDAGTGVAFVRTATADAAGSWGAPATLSDPADASVAFAPPQIAPDASGGALVGWTAQRLADPFDYAVQTSARSGGGSWSAPADVVTTDEPLSPLRLVGADGGDAVATWFQGSPAVLWGAMRTAGAWTVDDVSADVAPACVPLQALGADAGGGATVVWKARSTDGLESVRLTAGGWEPSATVFASRTESAEDVAVGSGSVVLVAHDAGTDEDSLLGSRRQQDGSWSGPTLLDAAGAGVGLGGLDLASDAGGDALASWTATDALGAKAVAAAAFQATGPQLSDISAPASGAVGEQLAFSARARSSFATVAQTSWDFGDGSPAVPGEATSHAYAQAGDYTATVTALDSAGNVSQATRQVSVAAAPSDGPPQGGGPPGGTPPGSTPPAETPPGGAPPGGAPAPHAKPAALLRPRVGGARAGVFALGAGSRTLRALVRNLDAAGLRGSVTLVRPHSDERPALTLASRHRVTFAANRRTAVALQLTDQALRALARASGHRLPVRLTLHLRAADGRRVSASLTATLDAAARFAVVAPARTAPARMAC